MAIVYYKNSKTNRTYAYESEAVWDPVKGYSVPKRKYLGRVDPETNTIIKSTGKRGRKPKDTSTDPEKTSVSDASMEPMQEKITALKQENKELQNEIKELRAENDNLKKVIGKSLNLLSSSLK